MKYLNSWRGGMTLVVLLLAAAMFAVYAVASPETERAPPDGFNSVLGFAYDADGVTPLPGCIVTITNTRTGDTIVWDETREFWDPTLNIYSVSCDEFLNGFLIGDLLNVTAVNGASIGWNESAITDNPYGYDQIDVTLNGVNPDIPEFPMVVLPAVGMMAIAAVVSLKRRR